jgi:hypothetical protein
MGAAHFRGLQHGVRSQQFLQLFRATLRSILCKMIDAISDEPVEKNYNHISKTKGLGALQTSCHNVLIAVILLPIWSLLLPRPKGNRDTCILRALAQKQT